MIPPLLESRAEIKKKSLVFLVQMKSLEFAFKINWPLVYIRGFLTSSKNGDDPKLVYEDLFFSQICF